MTAFERELGTALSVNTFPLGHPVPGLPEFVSQLLTAFETYDAPVDIGELSARYDVAPMMLRDFVHSFVAEHSELVG